MVGWLGAPDRCPICGRVDTHAFSECVWLKLEAECMNKAARLVVSKQGISTPTLSPLTPRAPLGQFKDESFGSLDLFHGHPEL